MNIKTLLSSVLLAVSLIVPSVAVTEEINLHCQGDAFQGGEGYITVNPDTEYIFSMTANARKSGWTPRATITDTEYKLELFDSRGTIGEWWTLNRITGYFTHITMHQSWTAKCQKISGAPKPQF